MPDVFISYSRRDSQFVRALADGLTRHGKDVWVDVEGIRDAERFPDALRSAIESSDAFLFVISPDSVNSEFCELEVAHAGELNKRIVPVALHDVPDADIPEEVRLRNWIPAEPDSPPVDRVITAIDTDLGWEKQHTDYIVRCLRWDSANRDSSMLLRGSELAEAEHWLTAGADKDPGPTGLEQEYIFASRSAASRRQRTLVGATSVMLIIALGLLVFALISRGKAVTAESTAKSQALAVESESQLSSDPELSVALAVRGVADHAGYGPTGSMFALRAALDASGLRAQVPGIGFETCSVPGSNPSRGQSSLIDNASIAYSPNGDQLAESSCQRKALRLINPTTGQIEQKIPLGGEGPFFTYVSTHRLVIDPDGRLELYDLQTHRVVKGGPRCFAQGRPALDPRAPVVAFPEYDDIVLWNYRTGQVHHLPLRHTQTSGPRQIAFSPNGRELAIATGNGGPKAVSPVMVISATTGRVLAATPIQLHDGLPNLGVSVAYSKDGQALLETIDGLDGGGAVTLANPRTLRPIRVLTKSAVAGYGGAVFTSRNGDVAYGLTEVDTAIVTSTGSLVRRLAGSSVSVQLAGDPTGTQFAALQDNRGVNLWTTSALASSTVSLIGVPGGFSFVATNQGPETVGIGSGDRLIAQRFSVNGSGRTPLTLLGNASGSNLGAVILSPDGRYAAVQPGIPTSQARPEPIVIWNLRTRRKIRTITTLSPNPNVSYTFAAAFVDSDRKLMITAYLGPAHYRAELITIRTGAIQTLENANCAQSDSADSMVSAAHADRVAVSVACPPGVTVYSSITGRRIGPPAPSPGTAGADSVALSPTGAVLAQGSADGSVILSDVATGRVIHNLTYGSDLDYTLAFSPDGRYLAVGDLHDLRIFDGHTGVELRVIAEPAPVYSVGFSPDGQTVYALLSNNALLGYAPCPDCEAPAKLLALGRSRVTTPLTAQQESEYAVK